MIERTVFIGCADFSEYSKAISALIPGYQVTSDYESGEYRLVLVDLFEHPLMDKALDVTILTDQEVDSNYTVLARDCDLRLLAKLHAMAVTVNLKDGVTFSFSLHLTPLKDRLLEMVLEKLERQALPFPPRQLAEESFSAWSLPAERVEESRLDLGERIPVWIEQGGQCLEAGEEWNLTMAGLDAILFSDDQGKFFLYLPEASHDHEFTLITPQPVVLPQFPQLTQLLHAVQSGNATCRLMLKQFMEAARSNDAEYLPDIEYPLLRARFYQQACRDLYRLIREDHPCHKLAAGLLTLKPASNPAKRMKVEEDGLIVHEFKPLVPYLETNLLPPTVDCLPPKGLKILDKCRAISRLGREAQLRESKPSFI